MEYLHFVYLDDQALSLLAVGEGELDLAYAGDGFVFSVKNQQI